MNNKNKTIDMLGGPILSSVIKYTIPVFFTSILQLLFNAADLVVVGQFCGSLSVSAVGVTGAITALIINLFLGLAVGVGVGVAHAVGCENNEALTKIIHTTIPIALVSGTFLTVVGVCFSKTFLRLMGTPGNVLDLAAVYMQIYFCGMIFSLVYNFGASILRALGDTRSPLVYLTIAGLINVTLNIIFVTLFDMNVAGVALATIISQAFSAVMIVVSLCKRTDDSRLDLRKMRFHKNELMRIIRIGLPAGIQASLFSISNVLIQSSVNSFGDIFIAGNSAAANLEHFVYVLLAAFHTTVVNFVGQNTGAREFKRIKKIFWTCAISVSVSGIIMGGLFYLFGNQLLSIYITDSPQAIEYGLLRMSFICLPYFLCGLVEVTTGALRGLGASVVPMAISVLGICVLRLLWIGTVFGVEKYHTPQCLFLSYTVSWIVTFMLQLIAFLILYNKACNNSDD